MYVFLYNINTNICFGIILTMSKCAENITFVILFLPKLMFENIVLLYYMCF